MYHVQFPGLGLAFTVDNVAFRLGSFSVYWYGIIIAAGFVLAFLYAMTSAKKFKVNSDKLMTCILVGIVCGIVGARLYYVLFYPGDMYLKNPMLIFDIHSGGLGFYGGAIGGLLGGCITAKLCKLNLPAVLDLGSLGLLIGQCIGRWGNFINQEAFGTQTDLPWRMVSEGTGGVPVHPCFLYESLWLLAGFVLLHFFSRRLRRYDGQVFVLYLLWSGLGRFWIEGLRTDSLLVPGLSLRVSQVLAAAMVIFAVGCLLALRSRTKLLGCGSARVMALNEIVDEVPESLIVEEDAPQEPAPQEPPQGGGDGPAPKPFEAPAPAEEETPNQKDAND